MTQSWDMGSWSTIIARLQPLIGLHRIRRPDFSRGIFLFEEDHEFIMIPLHLDLIAI